MRFVALALLMVACDPTSGEKDPSTDDSACEPVDYFTDADGDGFGDPASFWSACEVPDWGAAVAGDCDDNNAAVYPGASDACDELDNDCDGEVDEDATWQSGYADADADGYGDAAASYETTCAPGALSATADDCDDTSAAAYPGASEICDGLDNDCDGEFDEDMSWETVYTDGDGDGYGDPATEAEVCARDASHVDDDTDCDDADADINPAATEVCDSADNDCDGAIDEDDDSLDGRTTYTDADGDGYGDDATEYEACGALSSGESRTGGDCDDADADINPGETDNCNSTDDDCDGSVDEDATFRTYYRDADGDRYGDDSVTASYCSSTSGYVTTGGDCDDNSAAISPADLEICSGVDEDCDGLIDADDSSLVGGTTSYTDADGDGYGDLGTETVSCSSTIPSGSVDNADDLDDSDPDGGHVSSSDEADVTLDADDEGLFGVGAFLTVAEDWTGDGLPELLSGAMYTQLEASYSSHGFYYGSVQAWDSPGSSSPSMRQLTYEATVSGLDAVLFGDADGDGLSDLAVAAPLVWEFWSGCNYCSISSGGVALYSGAASGSLSSLGEIDSSVVGSLETAGFQLAAVDDQDGDDLAEIVSLSATDFHIASGTISLTASSLQVISPGEAIAGSGSSALLQTWSLPGMGDGLATIADMDGDGVQEVAISSEGVVHVIPADAATGLAGDVATVTVTPTAATPAGVADLGDIDGDGQSDLAFIADDWSDGSDEVGAVWLLPGGSSGALDTSGLDAITGQGSAATLGILVASAGDLDGDGEIELIAQGAYGDDDGLWLWSGPISGGGTTADAAAFYAASFQISALPDQPIDADADGYDDLVFAEIKHTGGPQGTVYTGLYLGDDDSALRLFFGE